MKQNNKFQHIYPIPFNKINNLQNSNRIFLNPNYHLKTSPKRKDSMQRDISSDNALQLMGNRNDLINNFKGNKAANIIEVPKKEVNIIINNNNNKIVNFKEKNNALKDELRIEKENNSKLIQKLKKYETQIINGENQNIKNLEKINELNYKIEILNNKLNTNKNNGILTIDQLNIYNGILKQKISENEKEINNLKNILDSVNKDIQNLKKEIIEKNQKIAEMENKNNQNINLIYKYKNEIDGLNKKYEEEIIKLKIDIGQLNLEKNNLNNKISQKDKDLFDLKNKMKDDNIKMQKLKRRIEEQNRDNLIKYRGEEMIVKFKSMDQTIDYVIPCYSEDPFYIIEDKLYEKFKKYREKNNIFIYGGRAILRFKSIKENKIDDSMPILLYDFNSNINNINNANILNSFCLLSNNNRNNQINKGRNDNMNNAINNNINNSINNNINNNANDNLTERSFMNFLNLLINLNHDNPNMRIFQNQ